MAWDEEDEDEDEDEVACIEGEDEVVDEFAFFVRCLLLELEDEDVSFKALLCNSFNLTVFSFKSSPLSFSS